MVSLLTAHSVVDETEDGVADPVNEAQDAVDKRFPVEAAVSLREFHGELVYDGTISEQAAVTYGLRFLEHMLGAVWPTDDDEDDDD